MPVDMERSHDGYRGRYRDRHSSGSMNRNQLDERSTRGNYHRSHPSHEDERNGNVYSPRNSPNGNYHYRSSRPSLNSRPVSSRNGPSTSHRHYPNDDYAPSSSSTRSTSSNNNNNNNSTQPTYYGSRSPSSRFDRPSNHRETYSSLENEQSMLSSSPPPSIPMHYSSTSQRMPLPRDRSLPLPPASYIDPERHRYVLPPSSSIYRRESPPPPVMSTYRNERSMDYAPRNTNNDTYMRREYRPPTPPSLAPLAIRGDPYGDVYRLNDYAPRSERYNIPSNRTETSSRDYPMASVSSSYRNDGYRKSSNVSMSPSPTSSSYISHDQYSNDSNYRPDYGISLSRPVYSSSMDHSKELSRNSRDHPHPDYRSSHHGRPNLKRSASRYDDNGGPIPSKRPMRR